MAVEALMVKLSKYLICQVFLFSIDSDIVLAKVSCPYINIPSLSCALSACIQVTTDLYHF